MEFDFSEEQEALKSSVREFARRELTPERIRKWDEHAEFEPEIFHALASNGLAGIALPPELGGQGADSVTTGVVIEELSKVDFNVANLLIIDNVLSAGILAEYGSQSLKSRIIPEVARGVRHMGIALTEPHAGSDAANIKTKAIRRGSGYVITGEKASISMVGLADYFVLFAKTSPERGAHGISAFLLPMDAGGVKTYSFNDMGYRPLRRGGIVLNDVEIPEENLIGKEGEGFGIVMRQFDYSKTLLSLACVGAAIGALEVASEYAKERVAFGRPILKFEGVQFRLVEHYTKLSAARLLCYNTLWLRDKGKPFTKEAAMCKWWGPRASVEAVHDSIITVGNAAYSRDYPLEKRLRDILGIEIGDGTADIQKIVVSRELYGRDFVPYR